MRTDKVNELIKQEVGKILLEEFEFEPGTFVTVMSADTSDGLEAASIWISVFPEGRAGSALETINKRIGEIQKVLNRRLALRFVPRIQFRLDKSESYASEIEEVFKEIDEEETGA